MTSLGINVTEDEAERADWVMTSRDKEGRSSC